MTRDLRTAYATVRWDAARMALPEVLGISMTGANGDPLRKPKALHQFRRKLLNILNHAILLRGGVAQAQCNESAAI